MKLLVIAAGFALGILPLAAPAQTSRPVRASNSQIFAPVRLCGYGTVSGTLQKLPGGASILRIETESPQKAQLLQAKFSSDFGLLPGVQNAEIQLGAQKIAVHEARAQGSATALRSGKVVFLVAAPTRALLAGALKTVPIAALAGSRAAVPVPMWLDRWDKFGFRHYYRPWELPAGQSDATYDTTKEFDYAQQQKRAGFVFWNDPLETDTTEDMMNTGWWSWAFDEAKKRDLPVGLNSMTPNATWILNRFRDQTQLKMPDFTGGPRDQMSPFIGGQGGISWNATGGLDAQMEILQKSLCGFVAAFAGGHESHSRS